MTRQRIRWIVLTGALAAIEVVLQIVGNYVAFGPVNINLSLIPIAVGAILLGPWSGAFLGFINGIAVILSPSTMAVFIPINAFGTIFICILKSTAAGLVSGLLFKLFKGKSYELWGMVLCSLIIPVINTALFIGGCYLFFYDWLSNIAAQTGYLSTFAALIFVVIGWNFVFEFATSAIFSPSICKVVQIFRIRHKVEE